MPQSEPKRAQRAPLACVRSCCKLFSEDSGTRGKSVLSRCRVARRRRRLEGGSRRPRSDAAAANAVAAQNDDGLALAACKTTHSPSPTLTPTGTATPTAAASPSNSPAASASPPPPSPTPESTSAAAAWANVSALVAGPTIADAQRSSALCARFAARGVSSLVVVGDSFGINAEIDVRRGLFGEASAPTRDDCWSQRRGGLSGPECKGGIVCDGRLRLWFVQTIVPFGGFATAEELNATLDGIVENALPAETRAAGKGNVVLLAWYFLWFLANDEENMTHAVPRVAIEVPPLLERLGANLNRAAFELALRSILI